MVECEIGFHRTQLVVFERRSQPLLATAAISVSGIFDASVSASVTQHVEVAADDVAEVDVAYQNSEINLKHDQRLIQGTKSISIVSCYLLRMADIFQIQ